MSISDFEYAIKRDVKNNPIVREVDRDRQREFGLTLALGGGLVVLVLLLAWQQYWLGSYRAEIARMRTQIEREQEVGRRLRLEEATRQDPRELERQARELRMVVPDPQHVIVLERTVSSPPPKSVIASREQP